VKNLATKLSILNMKSFFQTASVGLPDEFLINTKERM